MAILICHDGKCGEAIIILKIHIRLVVLKQRLDNFPMATSTCLPKGSCTILVSEIHIHLSGTHRGTRPTSECNKESTLLNTITITVGDLTRVSSMSERTVLFGIGNEMQEWNQIAINTNIN